MCMEFPKRSQNKKRTKKQASETQKNKRKRERNEAEMLKMRETQKMSKKVVTLKLEKDMSPHGSFTNVHIYNQSQIIEMKINLDVC